MTDGMGSAFKLIGYSASDLSEVTLPLAVIIESEVEGETCLAVYAANKVMDGDFAPSQTAGAIRLFLEDVRKCPAGSESERLFRHLADLGVGPIRFVAQSAANASATGDQISKEIKQAWPDISWPEAFVRF